MPRGLISGTFNEETRMFKVWQGLPGIRADQKTGSALLEFSGRIAMHGKSRVSSAIKYDCFKFDDSGNCIIKKTRLHCI